MCDADCSRYVNEFLNKVIYKLSESNGELRKLSEDSFRAPFFLFLAEKAQIHFMEFMEMNFSWLLENSLYILTSYFLLVLELSLLER